MVFALAQNTGWPEDYILWTVPLSRALQYWHAWLYSNGVWTVPPGPPVDKTLARLEEHLRMIDDSDEV